MRRECSSGGVVVYNDEILLLKKFNSNYVLPKGRMEEGESRKETALREVYEETGLKCKILSYLGEIHYTFYSLIDKDDIHKTVYWYLMSTDSIHLLPQTEEGFQEAIFFIPEKAMKLIRFDDEREIIRQAEQRIKSYKKF